MDRLNLKPLELEYIPCKEYVKDCRDNVEIVGIKKNYATDLDWSVNFRMDIVRNGQWFFHQQRGGGSKVTDS